MPSCSVLSMNLLIILFTAFVAAKPTPNKNNILPRTWVPYPGPIPYQDPKIGLPYQQSVTSNVKSFGLQTDLQILKDCLAAYGSYQFYNTWDGNDCGGLGWFKGSKNGKINPYSCYQTCASWIEGEAFVNGATSYQCDFEEGTKGHCWMGYHPAPSVPTSNSTAPVANS